MAKQAAAAPPLQLRSRVLRRTSEPLASVGSRNVLEVPQMGGLPSQLPDSQHNLVNAFAKRSRNRQGNSSGNIAPKAGASHRTPMTMVKLIWYNSHVDLLQTLSGRHWRPVGAPYMQRQRRNRRQRKCCGMCPDTHPVPVWQQLPQLIGGFAPNLHPPPTHLPITRLYSPAPCVVSSPT